MNSPQMMPNSLSIEDILALKERRNRLAMQHGLPPMGALMTNQYGMKWMVDGHMFAPDLGSLARDNGPVKAQDPRDLLPIIIPQNLSQRLMDFFIETDRCTSKYLLFVDTLPHLRSWQAHAHGHWVDDASDPGRILFFLDAAHLHETILAHELAHVWLALVEDCEDDRSLRSLSDAGKVRQLQYVQSFVLDCKVNEVIRERGFDMTIIAEQQREAILSLAAAVASGYCPPYRREAALVALSIATSLLNPTEESAPSASPRGVGEVASALKLLERGLPEVYRLAKQLADSVRQYGYADRKAICQTIDQCLQLTFGFTDGAFDIAAELEELPPLEAFQDKYPQYLAGLPVKAKLEVGRIMAKLKIKDANWRLSGTPAGRVQIAFQGSDGHWTEPVVLQNAPHWSVPTQACALPLLNNPASLSAPQLPVLLRASSAHLQIVPTGMASQPSFSQVSIVQPPVMPAPAVATPLPSMPMPWQPGRPFVGQPAPNLNPPRRLHGRNYMPGVALWLSQARLEEQLQGETSYGYGFNNPVINFDSSGEKPQHPHYCNYDSDCPLNIVRKVEGFCETIRGAWSPSLLNQINHCITQTSRRHALNLQLLTPNRLECLRNFCRQTGIVKCQTAADPMCSTNCGYTPGARPHNQPYPGISPVVNICLNDLTHVNCGNAYDHSIAPFDAVFLHELAHACGVSHGGSDTDISRQRNEAWACCLYNIRFRGRNGSRCWR